MVVPDLEIRLNINVVHLADLLVKIEEYRISPAADSSQPAKGDSAGCARLPTQSITHTNNQHYKFIFASFMILSE